MAHHEDNADFPHEKHNGRRIIWSNGLQNIGDQIVAAKTVLPWLLQAGGAPGFLIALLVPVREAGSILPQAALTPWVASRPRRKNLWILGSAGQGVAAVLIALSALWLKGWALGLVVILLLALLSLCRSLCSIISKDIQGATISAGHRGWVTGKATELGGIVTILVGCGLAAVRSDVSPSLLSIVLLCAGCSWFLASLVFHSLKEPKHHTADPHEGPAWWKDCLSLLREDAQFRLFVLVRSLLLVSALSTSFIVSLSAARGHGIAGLGTILVASGLSALMGGRISGWFSDRSSRLTMAWGAGIASILLLVIVALAHYAPDAALAWVLPVGYFLVNLAHTAIRVARKTYIVDMAEDEQRTRYVGAANTLMGVVLLVVGVLSGIIAGWGPEAALLFLAVLGGLGVVGARRLREVSVA